MVGPRITDGTLAGIANSPYAVPTGAVSLYGRRIPVIVNITLGFNPRSKHHSFRQVIC
jgi:hypothetical protein